MVIMIEMNNVIIANVHPPILPHDGLNPARKECDIVISGRISDCRSESELKEDSEFDPDKPVIGARRTVTRTEFSCIPCRENFVQKYRQKCADPKNPKVDELRERASDIFLSKKGVWVTGILFPEDTWDSPAP
eukprot:149841_1